MFVIHCARCDQDKPPEAFAWRNKAKRKRAPFCRECQAAYMREHYLANRELYIKRARQSKRQIRLERTRALLDYFARNPCTDCGETDPVVLDFDHVGEKSFDIGQMLAQHPWERVLAEIAKCEVVCANCHRRRTASRRPTVRLLLSRSKDQAGDGDRTRTKSLEGSCAAITPRPRGAADGSSETS